VEIYDSEEEQIAALKAWWKENNHSVITGAILGVALIMGWNYWQTEKLKQTEQAAALYGELLEFVTKDQKNSAEKVSQRLEEQYPSTAYASYAPLMQAKLKVSAGDLNAAKKILEAQMKKGDKALQNVARIELVRLMLASKEYEKGLQLIDEVDPASSKSFAASYEELTGDLYVALERLGEARTAYQNAIREGASSPLLQFKLDDIAAAETIQNPAH
jgi:predicted negative regulator of RcsB-dependent stress response